MVRAELSKWGQTLTDIRELSLGAAHRRTRERFLALYMVASGQKSAHQWAQESGRQTETVLSWLHRYNKAGPEALSYQRSGGRPPLFVLRRSARL